MTNSWQFEPCQARFDLNHRALFPNASTGLTGIVWEWRAHHGGFNGPGFGPVSHQNTWRFPKIGVPLVIIHFHGIFP